MQTNGGLISQSQQLQGIAWRGRRDLNLRLPSNISNLTPKTMQTNADKALECRQNADKFYLYYSLHGKGNYITETKEWGDLLGGSLTVKN